MEHYLSLFVRAVFIENMALAWFQVACPNCAAALQVKLPAGVTAVHCSQCEEVFRVDVPVSAVPERELSSRAKANARAKERGGDRQARRPRPHHGFQGAAPRRVPGRRGG